MKKFLALVLALVMTMSLVTISAGADFADQDDISYDEAVAVLSGMGVVGGSGGSFYPNSTLSRGAAAKIVAILVLGADGAAKLDANAAPFSDVPAGSTFAPYIAWAAEKGYIGGYPDGTYRPSNSLTGYAFLKMLLGALGYDAAIEGYGGANYGANVAEDAMAKGLLSGISGFVGSVAATREEACQMALNTLLAKRVAYDTKGTEIETSDGTKIVVGASAAKDVDLVDDSKESFMGWYQPKLVLVNSNDNDDFMRPARTWKFGNTTIGTFAKSAYMTFTGTKTEKEVYTALGVTANDGVYDDSPAAYAVASAYTNGYATPSSVSIEKADKTNKIGALGTTTEIYVTKTAGVITNIDIIYIQNFIGQVTAVKKNADGDRVVKVAGMEFKTEEFAVNDWVLYTVADDNDSNSITSADKLISVVAATKQTGKLTKVTGSDAKFVIDGVTYEAAANNASVATSGLVGKKVDFYCDADGYVLKLGLASGETTKVDNIALIEGGGSARGEYAELRYTDGTKATVETDKNYVGAGYDMKNYLVTFKTNEDGEVELTKASDKVAGVGSAYDNNVPTMGSAKLNNDTQFLVKTVDGSGKTVSFKSYTGYKSVPSFSSANYAFVNADNSSYALFVYVEVADTAVQGDSAVMTVVAYKPTASENVEADGVVYYDFACGAAGEVGTISMDASAISDMGNYYIVKSYTTNKNGVVTSASIDASTTRATKIEVKSGTLYIDTTNLGYTDDVAVYTMGTDYSISVGAISEIAKDTNDSANGLDPYAEIQYVTNSKGLVTTLLLIEA